MGALSRIHKLPLCKRDQVKSYAIPLVVGGRLALRFPLERAGKGGEFWYFIRLKLDNMKNSAISSNTALHPPAKERAELTRREKPTRNSPEKAGF
jgi:hypothetical protein